mgnify:CR=1 FL=1
MIKNNIKVNEDTAIDYLNKAIKTAQELENIGFEDIEVMKGEDNRCDYYTIINGLWKVSRDYHKNINIEPLEWNSYTGVSSSQRSEIYKKHFVGNNIKVMTKKKVQNAVLEYQNFSLEMREKQAENKKKIADFLETIKPHNPKTYQATPESEILSGWITKNGLEYHFEIQDGAYIKETIRIIGDTKLTDFIKLAK